MTEHTNMQCTIYDRPSQAWFFARSAGIALLQMMHRYWHPGACRFLLLLLALAGVWPIGGAHAGDQEQIDAIVKRDTAPFGVVFEIVEGDRNALEWAMPRIQRYANQLRQKFPGIGIAVVSHGKEEFALMKSNAEKHTQVHKIVQSLVKDEAIPVHVCGTHASWYGKKPEDFPDYIDVAPAGPTQIRNYEDMGYEKVVMEKP